MGTIGASSVLPPGMSSFPVSAGNKVIARWFCTPFVVCVVAQGLVWSLAGFEVAYRRAAAMICWTGTPVISANPGGRILCCKVKQFVKSDLPAIDKVRIIQFFVHQDMDHAQGQGAIGTGTQLQM